MEGQVGKKYHHYGRQSTYKISVWVQHCCDDMLWK